MRSSLSTPDHRRRNFEHDLVGLEVREILVARDGLAGLFVPGDQRRVGDRLGQLRNLDFDGHASSCLFSYRDVAAAAGAGVDMRRLVSRAPSSLLVARQRRIDEPALFRLVNLA